MRKCVFSMLIAVLLLAAGSDAGAKIPIEGKGVAQRTVSYIGGKLGWLNGLGNRLGLVREHFSKIALGTALAIVLSQGCTEFVCTDRSDQAVADFLATHRLSPAAAKRLVVYTQADGSHTVGAIGSFDYLGRGETLTEIPVYPYAALKDYLPFVDLSGALQFVNRAEFLSTRRVARDNVLDAKLVADHIDHADNFQRVHIEDNQDSTVTLVGRVFALFAPEATAADELIRLVLVSERRQADAVQRLETPYMMVLHPEDFATGRAAFADNE